jgi:hypothetical protein
VISIVIGIAASLLEGGSLGSILAALTLDQWLTIAAGIGADLLPLIEEKLGNKHPAIAALASTLVAGLGAKAAASAAHSYFDNQPPTIPGYGPDGALIEIPNPDYRS